MKKIILSIMALASMVVVKAQNEAITATLQHGDDVSVFTGVNAFVSAHEVAVDGDVITLSSGTFTPTTITKSVSIYGAGFEADGTNVTETTVFSASIVIGSTDSTPLSDVHIEGISIDGTIDLGERNIENLSVSKCQATGVKFFYTSGSNVLFDNCVILGNVSGEQATLPNSVMKNTYVSGLLTGDLRFMLVDHCVNYHYENNGYLNIRNSILFNYGSEYVRQSMGGSVSNCIYNGGYLIGTTSDIYLVNSADIFADGEDATYSSTRTFEIKQSETWIGTDGTEIGIRGGSGWSKVPSTPAVTNVGLQVTDGELEVTYEAETR